MRATDLLATDPEFAALIALWVTERRCPLVTADYLREKGMEGQAAGAEWAAWYRDRKLWLDQRLDAVGGPFPCKFSLQNGADWAWVSSDVSAYDDTDRIPAAVCHATYRSKKGRNGYWESAESALAAFLDGWADALADGAEVPTATVGLQLTTEER